MGNSKTAKRQQPYRKTLDLSGLFGLAEEEHSQVEESSASKQLVPLEVIHRQSEQVRRYFDPEKMEQLIHSVKTYGLLENLVVRPLPEGEGEYELVAGERRYRAALAAGLTEVPVLILELTETEARQIALIENLQREELNPVEETSGVLQLLSMQLKLASQEVVSLLYKMQNAHTRQVNHNVMVQEHLEVVEEIFTKLGRWSWQSFVKNRLPLLKLPQDILEALQKGKIAYTKAMTLKTVKDEKVRVQLLAEAITQNLSLSQIKEKIKALQPSSSSPSSPSSQLQTTYQRLKKSKLWENNPKKWKKVTNLLQKIEALIEEEAGSLSQEEGKLEKF